MTSGTRNDADETTYRPTLEAAFLEERKFIRPPQSMAGSAMVEQLNADPYGCIPGDPIVLHMNSSRETRSILCITTEGVDYVHTSNLTCLGAAQTRPPLHKIILAALSTFAPSKAAFNGGLQPPSPRSIQELDGTSHRAYREESSHTFTPSPSPNRFPLSALCS